MFRPSGTPRAFPQVKKQELVFSFGERREEFRMMSRPPSTIIKTVVVVMVWQLDLQLPMQSVLITESYEIETL